MTALDDIKELGKETGAASRKLVRALTQEKLAGSMAKKIIALRNTLLDAPGGAHALYRVAEFSARRVPVELAIEIWKETRRQFRAMGKEWESVEIFGEPQIDGVVEHLCKVLRDLAEKADSEYRAYVETAHLLSSPANAKALNEALEEVKAGKGKRMTMEEFLARKHGKL